MCVSLIDQTATSSKTQAKISGKAPGESISLCLRISNLPRTAFGLHQEESQTLTASKHRHRKVSGSRYSHILPPAGYALRHRHRKVSGNMYSHSLHSSGIRGFKALDPALSADCQPVK